MKKFAVKKALALVVAIVAVLGLSATVYAAVGNQAVQKIGDKYCVDTVTAEQVIDGVTVQTIERKWIPENRYNPNDPRNPYSSTPSPTPNTDKVQRLRQAGIDSRNDLQTYAWSYQWSTTSVEKSANDSELRTEITFQVDESVSADRWVCTFVQIVKFDNAGSPYVRYYIGDQKYSVAAIKRMLSSYGKAR